MCVTMAEAKTLEWRRRENFTFFVFLFSVALKLENGIECGCCCSLSIPVQSFSPPRGEEKKRRGGKSYKL